jgi:hypothetical protein
MPTKTGSHPSDKIHAFVEKMISRMERFLDDFIAGKYSCGGPPDDSCPYLDVEVIKYKTERMQKLGQLSDEVVQRMVTMACDGEKTQEALDGIGLCCENLSAWTWNVVPQTPCDHARQCLERLARHARGAVRGLGYIRPRSSTGTSAPLWGLDLKASRRPDHKLSDAERTILKLCRKKAMIGERIASHEEISLSFDYTRRLLARLVKEDRLTNGPDGYRSV